MTPIIEVKKVSYSYGTKRALDNISFSLERGEFFCFLGPNGAGKSTTVKILTGQLPLQEGAVVIQGHAVNRTNLRAIKYHVGVLTDNMSLPKELTVQELLYFTGRAFDLSSTQATAKSRDVLSEIQLEEHASVKIGHLSSGLLRRLEIGQALMNDPEILFLDEPTIFLDPLSTHEILGLIQKLHNKGTTIFYTTHLLKEVEHICTYLAIIKNGKILLCDKVAHLKEREGYRIDITMKRDDALRASSLFRQHHWETTVEQNVISISVPRDIEVESLLPTVTDILNQNRLKYSDLAIKRVSLDQIYADIVSGSEKYETMDR